MHCCLACHLTNWDPAAGLASNIMYFQRLKLGNLLFFKSIIICLHYPKRTPKICCSFEFYFLIRIWDKIENEIRSFTVCHSRKIIILMFHETKNTFCFANNFKYMSGKTISSIYFSLFKGKNPILRRKRNESLIFLETSPNISRTTIKIFIFMLLKEKLCAVSSFCNLEHFPPASWHHDSSWNAKKKITYFFAIAYPVQCSNHPEKWLFVTLNLFPKLKPPTHG